MKFFPDFSWSMIRRKRGRNTMDLSTLTTEMPNPRSARLSTMNIREALTLMNEEDKLVLRSIQEQIPAIERLITKTADALQNGGRIIYMGAGTSGRLALLDALECPPTFGVSPLCWQEENSRSSRPRKTQKTARSLEKEIFVPSGLQKTML